MLNTALRTSQQRVLGTAILQWDMFSLDVCYVLYFYREIIRVLSVIVSCIQQYIQI